MPTLRRLLLLLAFFVGTKQAESTFNANEQEDRDSGSFRLPPKNVLTATLIGAARYPNQRHRSTQTGQEEVVTENGEASSLRSVCAAVEAGFGHDGVHCECAGSLFGFFTMTCEFDNVVCIESTNTSTSCGRPIMASSLVDGRLFSSTSCVHDYQIGDATLKDTCVSVEVCPDENDALCSCHAQQDSMPCNSCQICHNGKGVMMDCTNVDLASAVLQECSPIDMDLDMKGGAGTVLRMEPDLEAFCSQLASSFENSVHCSCTPAESSSSSSSFTVLCETDGSPCPTSGEQECLHVSTEASIHGGKWENVKTCAHTFETHHESKSDGSVVCSNFQLCQDDANRLCECSVTYNDQACRACHVCEDGASIQMDCSNVQDDAVEERCQMVSPHAGFEFVPPFFAPGASSTSSSSSAMIWLHQEYYQVAISLLPIWITWIHL